MHVAELMQTIKEIVDNPAQQVRDWKKEQGGKAIGFLLTDVPEELIHAAGFFPYAISGGGSGLEQAEAHLQGWTCSFVRSSLGMALDGELDFLDGLIIPQTCDTTRMVAGIWKHVSPLPFMQNYLLPRQVNRSSAKHYLVGEVNRIKERLEEYRGEPIAQDDIRQSISLYNSNRELLRHLLNLHKYNPEILNNRDYYTLIKAAMIMPREKLNEILNKLVYTIEANRREKSSLPGVRLILSGSLWEPPELFDYIDEAGATVVGDDFQNGFRYIESNVRETGDPIEALADRQLKRIPFACYDILDNGRSSFLVNLARQQQAHGVIFLHLKYCEPENYDYYDNLRALEEHGFPTIRIESEFGRGSLGQLHTRVSAFIEMVGGEG